jgi:hypothetical protein
MSREDLLEKSLRPKLSLNEPEGASRLQVFNAYGLYDQSLVSLSIRENSKGCAPQCLNRGDNGQFDIVPQKTLREPLHVWPMMTAERRFEDQYAHTVKGDRLATNYFTRITPAGKHLSPETNRAKLKGSIFDILCPMPRTAGIDGPVDNYRADNRL